MNRNFGSKELIHCLIKLGFLPKTQHNSSHQKFIHPEGKTGEYPFFTVQLERHGYGKNSCERYVEQLKKFGFSKENIEKYLK